MRLHAIELQHFRNHQHLSLTPQGAPLILLTGPNGSGKTNILEAIYLASLTKSFRTDEERNCLAWGAESMQITLQTREDTTQENTTVQIAWTRSPWQRRIRVNEVVTRPLDLVGTIPLTLFAPDDMNLFFFSPQFRRRYLNILLSELYPAYRQALLDYHRVLKNRNALLKKIREQQSRATELEFWDETLIQLAPALISPRQHAIAVLNQFLSTHYQNLSGHSDELSLRYQSAWENLTATDIRPRLHNQLNLDLRYGSTTLGPHRDDFSCYLNQRELTSHGSRGEARSALIALKKAEIKLFQQIRGVTPLLLLDDVFSELDEQRQYSLIHDLTDVQLLITTTEVRFPLPTDQVFRQHLA